VGGLFGSGSGSRLRLTLTRKTQRKTWVLHIIVKSNTSTKNRGGFVHVLQIKTGSVVSGTKETVSSPTWLRTDCSRASMAQRTASMT